MTVKVISLEFTIPAVALIVVVPTVNALNVSLATVPTAGVLLFHVIAPVGISSSSAVFPMADSAMVPSVKIDVLSLYVLNSILFRV